MLKPKQQAFVREYLIDKNASAAARRAGYSEKTAGTIGFENLKKPQIAAAIEQAMQEQAHKAHITTQEVLQGLAREAKGEGPDTTSNARIQALKALGDYLGMWSPTQHEVKLDKQPSDMTDEELMEALHAYQPN
jgi:phage terminase small subunit